MKQKTGCTTEEMERLVDQYGTSMLRVCCGYLKNISLAQDAVQDSFLKIYKAWPGFEDAAHERAWVMRVTINVCRDMLRSSWNSRVTLVEQYPEIPGQTQQPQEGGRLLQEIQKLRPKYREVILLYYYQELQVREIAQILKTSRSAVSMRLVRARDTLEKALCTVSSDEW